MSVLTALQNAATELRSSGPRPSSDRPTKPPWPCFSSPTRAGRTSRGAGTGRAWWRPRPSRRRPAGRFQRLVAGGRGQRDVAGPGPGARAAVRRDAGGHGPHGRDDEALLRADGRADRGVARADDGSRRSPYVSRNWLANGLTRRERIGAGRRRNPVPGAASHQGRDLALAQGEGQQYQDHLAEFEPIWRSRSRRIAG